MVQVLSNKNYFFIIFATIHFKLMSGDQSSLEPVKIFGKVTKLGNFP